MLSRPASEYGGADMMRHASPMRRRDASPAPKNEPNLPPGLSEESLKEIDALSETGTSLLRKGRHAQVCATLAWAGVRVHVRVPICTTCTHVECLFSEIEKL